MKCLQCGSAHLELEETAVMRWTINDPDATAPLVVYHASDDIETRALRCQDCDALQDVPQGLAIEYRG